ncbi:MAG: four helix bundle protein [Actinomyces sp.]|nr:MAG: four helix bundle protein [Actinomyces sp.]
MRDFKNLKVWEKAHRLTLDVYRATEGFPRDERFGLTGQLRRAAASIATNIAEGCGRDSDAELGRFVAMAAGSTSETEYHLLLARDLGYLDPEIHARLEAQTFEVRKMLAAFLKRLKADR